MKTTTVLQMNFTTYENKNFTLRLVDPRDDLTSAEIQEVMELILEKDLFPLVGAGKLKDAKTVQTTTNTFDVITVG